MALQGEIDHWLQTQHGRIDPRFPPALEAIYGRETAAGRRRAMKISTLVGCATGTLLIPAFWRLLPDAHPALWLWWAGLGIPTGVICHISFWTRVELAVLERWMAAAGVFVILCFIRLLTAGAHGTASLLLVGVLLMIMLDLVAARLSFAVAWVFTLAQVALFGAGVQLVPNGGGLSGVVLLVLMAVTSLFALYGNWQLETELRRSFALMLRERLRQAALAQDNVSLRAQAQSDPLTGLGNRRAFDGWMQAAWQASAAAGTTLGVIAIDVDRFKAFNDIYGHPAGDNCLHAIAACLAAQLRDTTDPVARLGGEEFAVLLPCAPPAMWLREAVLQLRLPHLGNGATAFASISCGAATLVPCGASCPDALMRAADTALYQAKQTGRNRACLADAVSA
jgi:diguanylate cyclase (GGDEF)-like protein